MRFFHVSPPMPPTNDDHAADSPAMHRKVPRIVWVIPVAGVLIVALILARSMYGPLWRRDGSKEFQPRPAPEIVLFDQGAKRHRTARYLGRRKLIVLFFDGQTRPENVRPLVTLRDAYLQIQDTGAEIVAISEAPPETMAGWGGGSIPFPILSDVDYAVRKQWGVSADVDEPLDPVLFLVDTTGVIRSAEEFESADSPIDLPLLLKQLAQLP